MTQIQSRIQVSVTCMAAPPAPKELLVSLSPLCEPATGTGEAGASRVHHRNSKAMNRCQQQDAMTEHASAVLLPANQPFRVFHSHASARPQGYEHCLSGFAGEDVPLVSYGQTANPLLLMLGFPFFLSLEHRPQVRPPIAIAAGDSGTGPHVTPQPACGLLDLGQRDGDKD